ncbi:hypothetical protein BpHYR1_035940 [Brachionus plicatilis]|uniref:Uncharacterized protein n=1 Tax=Brachionus plicatilis TaxID=10195 RepID=A0A3M7QRW6_BRAPC|nr:hypothetical protein BpHYR1_035940 [Brachionus plicatilis]
MELRRMTDFSFEFQIHNRIEKLETKNIKKVSFILYNSTKNTKMRPKKKLMKVIIERNRKNFACLSFIKSLILFIKSDSDSISNMEKIVKTFMLKLQENSDIWQIYCIKQPKKMAWAKCLSIEQFRKERRNSKIAITQWSWVFNIP